MSLRWGAAGHRALLGAAALGTGLAVVALPPALALALIAGAALLVAALIEPMAALMVALSAAPLKTLIETEAEAALPLDVGQVAVAGLVLAWFARKAADRGQIRAPRSPIFAFLLLFMAAAALSLVNALSLGVGLTELLKWVEIALLAFLTIDMIASPRAGDSERRQADVRLGWAVLAVLVAGATQAIIGLYEFFGGSGAEHLAILGGTRYRAFGSFGQPNPFAGFIGVCLALGAGATWGALTAWWDARKRAAESQRAALLRLAVYGALTAPLAAALLASWSRGAWMGVMAALVAMALFLPRKRLYGLLLIGAAAALAMLLWASGRLPGAVVERLTDFTDLAAALRDVRGVDIDDANYAEIERLAHWQAAVAMANDHPWLGVGFGNYAAAYPAYRLMNWPDALGHAHNYYLNLLAETGWAGLGAYLLLWAAVFAMTLRALRRTAGFWRGAALGLLGAWTHLAVHSLLDKLYVNNVFLHVGVLLGILAVLCAPGVSSPGQGAARASRSSDANRFY